MRKAITASLLFAVSTAANSAIATSARAASFVSPVLPHQSTVLKVNHHRHYYGGYYGYYPSYPAYNPYYYAAPVVTYPPPVVYYPAPRYYAPPAVYGGYGPYGAVVVTDPENSYYNDVDW